jgi:hypothetical protein
LSAPFAKFEVKAWGEEVNNQRFIVTVSCHKRTPLHQQVERQLETLRFIDDAIREKMEREQ